MNKTKVLYVDDEKNNLLSMKAAFRREFEIFTAKNAQEGRYILENEEIEVVIADQKMPETTGVEFFESIRLTHPHPVRVLITGYSDISSVIDAINKGKIYHYINKPWNEQDVREVILSAAEVYHATVKKEEELDFFVYKLSHDLRGPLTSIEGLLDVARKSDNDPKSREICLDYIGKSIKKLEDRLSDLIEFKRMEKILINFDDIKFEEIIRDVQEALQHHADFQNVSFTMDVEQTGTFISDQHIVRSILQNIIQNALKYSKDVADDAFVKVQVKADDQAVKIVVSDNGRGMSEEVKKNAFKMFYRGSTKSQGSGLGLYIVKTGLDKLNGNIQLDSTESHGTNITIEFSNLLAIAAEDARDKSLLVNKI